MFTEWEIVTDFKEFVLYLHFDLSSFVIFFPLFCQVKVNSYSYVETVNPKVKAFQDKALGALGCECEAS